MTEVVPMLAREAHFRVRVQYAAAPDWVYAALAAPGGATGWWSTRGGRVTGAGDRLRLDWSDTEFIEFDVEVAERPTAMRWRCVAPVSDRRPGARARRSRRYAAGHRRRR